MYIDKNLVESMEIETNRKIREWKDHFPTLEFDKFGRAKIGEVVAGTEIYAKTFGSDCSYSFIGSFEIYLIDKGYRLKYRNGSYYSSFYVSDVDFEEMSNGYFHFKTPEEKMVKIKVSKVLAGVQEFWLKRNPEYTEVCNKLKTLRALGLSYEDSPEIRRYTNDKKIYESGNWYFIHQNLSNQTANTKPIMLSVNPLDLLTASGDSDENPTGFGSCWSVGMTRGRDDIYTWDDGCYASNEGILNMGKINNRGIMYVPNDRTLEVPHTKFEFIGYMDRIHVWFDETYGGNSGIFFEKPYPSKDSYSLEKYRNTLQGFNAELIKSTSNDVEPFRYQDWDGIATFLRGSTNIFMDKTCVDNDDGIQILPQDRMSYNYDDGISNPDGSKVQCADCGHTHSEDDMTYIDNYGYVCQNCLDEYYTYCNNCREYVHNDSAVLVRTRWGENWVCESCTEDFGYCEGYEQYTSSEIYYIDNLGGYYSEEWLEDNDYTTCSECGEWIYRDDLVEVIVNGYKYWMCESCAIDNYSYCQGYERYDDNCVYVKELDGIYSIEWLESNDYSTCKHCDEFTNNTDGICDSCSEELDNDDEEVVA